LESNAKPLFSDLYERVISSESMCSGCGACVLICPKNRLVFRDFKPEQVSGARNVCPENENGRCGLCAMVCHRLHGEVLGCNGGEEVVGKYLARVAGRATDRALRERGQDSGFVSGILNWGVLSGTWAGFLGYTRDESWQIQPLVVTEGTEVIKTSGSKYTYTSLIDGFSQLRRLGLSSKPFAVVGLPCHIAAIRRLKKLNSKYVKGLVLSIGLFCMKAFSYEGLIEEKLIEEMNVPIADVHKMDIRKGMFTVEMKSGDVRQLPVKELQRYGHVGCASCCDFSAESADISVGGLGIGGWTIALIRTEAGQKVVDAATSEGVIETRNAEDFSKALQVLEKLAFRKREQAVVNKA
jgi:coenzyme F420 hydrogenase subunit beta